MNTKTTLMTAVAIGALSMSANAFITVIADPAADYVTAAGSTTTALTTLPSGWSYFVSSEANGGTEVALTSGPAGTDGGTGWTSGGASGTAAVQGTDPNGGDYELFSNGDVNGGVLGTDLLMHPSSTATTDYVIVRYTVGINSLFATGNGVISGNFRELIVGGNAARESVSVAIYQNATQLFATAGGTTAQGTPGILTATAGAFNLTGLTFMTGDTLDFVVGINGHFGADETALNAQIIVVPEPSLSVALISCLGIVGLFARRRS